MDNFVYRIYLCTKISSIHEWHMRRKDNKSLPKPTLKSNDPCWEGYDLETWNTLISSVGGSKMSVVACESHIAMPSHHRP